MNAISSDYITIHLEMFLISDIIYWNSVKDLCSSSGGGPKAWHYYWCYGLLTNRGLSWLLSERPNKQLKESDADICTQPMDRSLWPCGLIRKKVEEAEEEEGESNRKNSSLSTNLDPQLSDTKPPTR